MHNVVFTNEIAYPFPNAKQISLLRGTTLDALSFNLLEGDLMKEHMVLRDPPLQVVTLQMHLHKPRFTPIKIGLAKQN